ncbi:ABC transporter substrate-binding protein [Caldanaerobius polysaccharolyticus]|uniref:ABC transporter substrate-binding protein n=1 Tax=Caldanaerobius polysaccharolyticus TaxID=44256 RepID=UPI00047C5DFF|nr:ABC transporter substrate-binding protein [Caldanaerobius polysaccharolyticus]
MSISTRKIISLMTAVAILFTLLTGCGSKTTSKETSKSGEQSKTSEKGTTLTLLVDNQSSLDGIKAVIEAFEKKTGIKTKIDLRPGGSEGDNIVKTRLATGEMDDLCYYNSGSLFQALNPEANFVDLTDEPYVANFDDAFKATVSYKGKVYGIPGGTTAAGVWLYNKKVYNELGLKVPKTWDELLANLEKIKAAGKTPVIGSYKDDWTSQLIVLADYYNVQVKDPNFATDFTANKAKFATTPAALRSFEKQQEIFKKGYMNKDFLATTYDRALKMLAEGTGAHYPMLTVALPNIYRNFPDKIDDIGAFAQPGDSADKNGLTVWMPAGIYIYKNSKNIDAAKKWVEFFVSKEGIDAFLSKEKAQGPFPIKGVNLPEDTFAAVKDLLPYFKEGKIAPALEFLTPLKGPNLPQICVENGSGAKSPKEAAAEYDKDVEKQAKQLGLQGW